MSSRFSMSRGMSSSNRHRTNFRVGTESEKEITSPEKRGPLSSAYEKVHVSYLYLNFVEERHKTQTGGFIINTATGDLVCYKILLVFHIVCDNFKNGVCSSSSQLVSMEAWGKDESDH